MQCLFFIGVDLGGSGTRAALADDTGQVLATGRGPTGLHGDNPTSARRAMATALEMALAPMRQLVGGKSCAVCAGTRGLSIPDRRELLLLELKEQLPGAEVRVTNDAIIAFWGGLAGGEGIGVVAGSGSIAFARDRHGREGRAGGWGYILGDEGSGYWLGQQALLTYIRGLEGRSPHGPLWQAIARALGLTTITDVLAWFYGGQNQVERLAALAPVVSEAAEAHDQAALDILAQAGRSLAEQAAAAARQVWPTALPGAVRVIRAGGVWAAGHALEEAFVARLAATAPGAQLTPPSLPPVGGALLLAMGAERAPVAVPIVQRLAAGLSSQPQIT